MISKTLAVAVTYGLIWAPLRFFRLIRCQGARPLPGGQPVSATRDDVAVGAGAIAAARVDD